MTVFGKSLTRSKLSKHRRSETVIYHDVQSDTTLSPSDNQWPPVSPALPAPPSEFGAIPWLERPSVPSPTLPERASVPKLTTRPSLLRFGSTLGLGRKLSKCLHQRSGGPADTLTPTTSTSPVSEDWTSDPFSPISYTSPLSGSTLCSADVSLTTCAPALPPKMPGRSPPTWAAVDPTPTTDTQLTPRRRTASGTLPSLSLQEHRDSLRTPRPAHRAERVWRAKVAALSVSHAGEPPSPVGVQLYSQSSASSGDNGPVTPPLLLRKGYGPLPPPRRRLARPPTNSLGHTEKSNRADKDEAPLAVHSGTPRPGDKVPYNDVSRPWEGTASLRRRKPSVPCSVFSLSLEQIAGAGLESASGLSPTADRTFGGNAESAAEPNHRRDRALESRRPILGEQSANLPSMISQHREQHKTAPAPPPKSKVNQVDIHPSIQDVYPYSSGDFQNQRRLHGAPRSDRQGHLTPGFGGGLRPPKSGMPRSDMERWLGGISTE